MTAPASKPSVVDALLGPTGQQIGCDECFDTLDQYIEIQGDADADSAFPGMRTHLAGCPACLEEYESLRALVG